MPEEINSRGNYGYLAGLVVLGGLFYLAGQYLASAPQRIEQEAAAEREITVTGQGEVMAVPDVAKITLGVTTGTQASAEVAMQILTERFTAVVSKLSALGIEEKDVKTTNLSTQPIYDYRDGRQTVRGYEATEAVEVTIRETDKVGEVVAQATGEGVNQTSGISFEIDDRANLENEAQAQAIDDAKQKAEVLADKLGVKLGRVKNFQVEQGFNVPMPFYATAEMDGRGAGGPPVPEGEQKVSMTVKVTFELK